MITIGSVPVKSRVPLMAWVLAGLVTLMSLASTLTHTVADQRIQPVHQARMN
jgi:hypothetical protein